MSSPAITYYQITSIDQNATQTEQVNRLNHGGAVGAAVSNQAPFNFGPAEAGFWCQPQVLLVQFAGNTAKSLTFHLFDTAGTGAPRMTPVVTDQGEDLVPVTYDPADAGNWHFKMSLKQAWADPTTISTDPNNSEIAGWTDVPVLSNSPTVLDTLFHSLSAGNDGTTHLLTQDTLDASKYYGNFFLYLAVQPQFNAIAGTHQEWGFRLGYVYPGDPIS